MVAAPFVVGAARLRARSALIIRRFYAAPIVAMLGTYALGLIIREIVRGLIGGLYLVGARADRRRRSTIGGMHFSAWRFTIIVHHRCW